MKADQQGAPATGANATRHDPPEGSAVAGTAVPPYSWGGLLSPVFLCVLASSVAVALAVPEALAGSHPLALKFASGVREALLTASSLADIGPRANTTGFPAAALLSHAYMWTCLLFLLVYNSVAAIANWERWGAWLETLRRVEGLDSPRLFRNHKVAMAMVVGMPALYSMVPGSTSLIGNADLEFRTAFAALTGGTVCLWQGLFHGYLPRTCLYILERRKAGSR